MSRRRERSCNNRFDISCKLNQAAPRGRGPLQGRAARPGQMDRRATPYDRNKRIARRATHGRTRFSPNCCRCGPTARCVLKVCVECFLAYRVVLCTARVWQTAVTGFAHGMPEEYKRPVSCAISALFPIALWLTASFAARRIVVQSLDSPRALNRFITTWAVPRGTRPEPSGGGMHVEHRLADSL